MVISSDGSIKGQACLFYITWLEKDFGVVRLRILEANFAVDSFEAHLVPLG